MAQEFTEANKAYFDKIAAEYGSKPWHQNAIVTITEELQKQVDFIGADRVKQGASVFDKTQKKVRLLDYACGVGMVTMALQDHVTQTVGIDIAPNMISKYNEAMKVAGVDAHAIEGDLLNPKGVSEDLSTPELHGFDVAAVGLGFHHFDSPALAVKRLAERLNPGGVILIIDGASHGSFSGHTKADNTIRTPHGFSEQAMKELYEAEGLEGIGYYVLPETIKLGADEHTLREVKLFFGRAQKRRA